MTTGLLTVGESLCRLYDLSAPTQDGDHVSTSPYLPVPIPVSVQQQVKMRLADMLNRSAIVI